MNHAGKKKQFNTLFKLTKFKNVDECMKIDKILELDNYLSFIDIYER